MSEDTARSPDGIEHRRSPRYPVSPYGGAVAVVGAQLLNVSAHGALIESLVPMETDSVMPLRLIVCGSKVDVEARVANCNAAAGEKRRVFRIGLEFVSIPGEAREQLAEVLKTPPQAPKPHSA
jgi:hypothetical protein